MSNQWSPDRLDALNRLTTAARLLSTAIHETSNALQVISGNAELAEAQAGDADKVKARAQTIKAQADRAGLRLRALAALASAPPGGTRARIDLKQVAERALDLRRYTLSRTRIAVSIEVAAEASGGAVALADNQALLRVVTNLVLNAEQALAGKAGGAITMRIAADGPRVTLAVSDNGPGVPDDRRERIFLPFDNAGQSGCGLAVARWVVEKDGGTLTLDATATGATFVMSLPAA